MSSVRTFHVCLLVTIECQIRVQTYTQHWDSGARMDGSSVECFPNLRTHKSGADTEPQQICEDHRVMFQGLSLQSHPLALSKCRRNPSSPNLVKIS